MNCAIVGCGYVADFYLSTVKNYESIKLLGVYDNDPIRLKQFCNHYSLKPYSSLEEVLNNEKIELIINLTNPKSHFEVTKKSLESGKHVYSEKPMAMNYESAKKLSEIANLNGLVLSCAPCNLLSPSSRALFKILERGYIGDILLVYANFDAGFNSFTDTEAWKNESGSIWPAKDEYEVGCTFEHAGYVLTLLSAFFGAAKKVSSFSTIIQPTKLNNLKDVAPDFSVGCIEYENGAIARVTNSLIGPLDRSLTIIGSKGKIYVQDIRDDNSAVFYRKDENTLLSSAEYRLRNLSRLFQKILFFFPFDLVFRLKLYKRAILKKSKIISNRNKPVDFCRGISAMISSIESQSKPILDSDLGIHVCEIIEKLQYPNKINGVVELDSSFQKLNSLD